MFIITVHTRANLNRHQKLELHLTDQDGDSLGSCEVNPENMVMEFVSAAAGFLNELVGKSVQKKKALVETDNGVHIDDCDSVLGSQTQDFPTQDSPDNLPPEQDAGGKTASWEAIREANIPPCVKEINFTINDEDLVPELREKLKSSYSGVTIVSSGIVAEKERAWKALTAERPDGIKQMIIELDETEIAQTPELESNLRKMYPWAMIEARPGPNISRKRARRMTDSNVATPHRPDLVKHIEDFAAYVIEPPSEDEFGYKYPIGEGWDRLPYSRKFEIAHARAIQHYHGKVVDGKGCGCCESHGYQCKVYLPQLGNLSHITFGHSCQHCRLRQIQCDLPAAMKDHPNTPRAPNMLRLDTQNTHHHGEAVNTPPTTTTSRSLASRITAPDRIRPDAGEEEDDNNDTPIRVSPTMDILELADMLQLLKSSNYKVRGIIYSMYKFLRETDKVEPFGKYPSTLSQYYENLITLYILTYLREEYDLAFVVLLRFQSTNYQETTQLPTIDTVVRAFEHLPTHAPLCRWIAISYSFLWDTQAQGEWGVFINTNPDVKPKFRSLAKLLHGICYIRDPFTTGGDIAVRKRWCEVHNHLAEAPHQKRACERVTAEFGDSAEEAEKRWKQHEMQQAKEKLALLENDNRWGDTIGSSTPRVGEKRRAESSPMSRPFRVGRGGRGRGRGRGPSR